MSTSRSSNAEIQNVENFGFSHVLEEYLDRYMQDYKKTISLWIKNYTSVNKINTKWMNKINVKVNVKVIKCRNSKCGKLGFHTLWNNIWIGV